MQLNVLNMVESRWKSPRLEESTMLQLRYFTSLLLYSSCLLSATVAGGGEADVLNVEVTCKVPKADHPASICRFEVTVQHGDTGWKHYANRYDVLDVNGPLISSRVLRHPHVDEQPFTRVLGPIAIRHDVDKVKVRANDVVHGTGGAEVIVEIPHARGDAAQP
jgi:hypothetical protein